MGNSPSSGAAITDGPVLLYQHSLHQARQYTVEERMKVAAAATKVGSSGEAYVQLGEMCETGTGGLAVDFKKAMDYYRHAASEKGSVYACVRGAILEIQGHGQRWRTDKYINEWLFKFQPGLLRISPEVMTIAGYLLAHNRMDLLKSEPYNTASTKDAQAVMAFQNGAAKGYGPAVHNLAVMTLRGRGIAQSTNNAYELFWQAAKLDVPESQFQVARMLSRGEGVGEDKAEGKRWLEAAAKNGVQIAQQLLTSLAARGPPLRHSSADLVGTVDEGAEDASRTRLAQSDGGLAKSPRSSSSALGATSPQCGSAAPAATSPPAASSPGGATSPRSPESSERPSSPTLSTGSPVGSQAGSQKMGHSDPEPIEIGWSVLESRRPARKQSASPTLQSTSPTGSNPSSSGVGGAGPESARNSSVPRYDLKSQQFVSIREQEAQHAQAQREKINQIYASAPAGGTMPTVPAPYASLPQPAYRSMPQYAQQGPPMQQTPGVPVGQHGAHQGFGMQGSMQPPPFGAPGQTPGAPFGYSGAQQQGQHGYGAPPPQRPYAGSVPHGAAPNSGVYAHTAAAQYQVGGGRPSAYVIPGAPAAPYPNTPQYGGGQYGVGGYQSHYQQQQQQQQQQHTQSHGVPVLQRNSTFPPPGQSREAQGGGESRDVRTSSPAVSAAVTTAYPGEKEMLAWLVSIGMERYYGVFSSQELDLEGISLLSREQVSSMGITKLGPLNRIDSAITELQKAREAGQPLSDVEKRKRRRSKPEVNVDDILINDITIEKRLGGGNFGDVYRGLWQRSITVALKCLKSDGEDSEAEFMAELSVLMRLRHPNIVTCYGVYEAERQKYIVLELASEGTLTGLLRQLKQTAKDEMLIAQQDLVAMATDAARGMLYLSERNPPVVHRDLSLRNLLLHKQNGQLVVKVSDFGLARFTSIEEELDEGAIYVAANACPLPVKWIAPETVDTRRFGTQSDAWSFGIVLYELFSFGTEPYKGWTIRETLTQLREGYRLPQPECCTDAVYSIMQRCWDRDPSRRPTFREIYGELSKELDAVNRRVMRLSASRSAANNCYYQSAYAEAEEADEAPGSGGTTYGGDTYAISEQVPQGLGPGTVPVSGWDTGGGFAQGGFAQGGFASGGLSATSWNATPLSRATGATGGSGGWGGGAFAEGGGVAGDGGASGEYQ